MSTSRPFAKRCLEISTLIVLVAVSLFFVMFLARFIVFPDPRVGAGAYAVLVVGSLTEDLLSGLLACAASAGRKIERSALSAYREGGWA